MTFQKQPREVFFVKGVLRKFTKLIGKHLCQSFCFNNVAGLRPAFSLKQRLWHRCFPVNFVKYLRTHFFQNTSGRLLLTFALSVQILQSPSSSLRSLYIIDLAIKVGLSPLRKKFAIFASMKALKNDEKCFLFHLKISFRSQDI